MRILIFISLFFLSGKSFSQTYKEVKNRFDNYLNYHGSLDKYVEISAEKIIFYKFVNGKKETDLVLSKDDWRAVSELIKFVPADSVEKLYKKIQSKKNFDVYAGEPRKKLGMPSPPLTGVRIIIDPGHIAGNLKMARIEQKYLHFTKANYPDLKQDSLDIAEGILTFQTASLLKRMLEEKGAEVALTRKDNSTTFGISYEEWLKNYKTKTLDSLLGIKKITAQKHKQLLRMSATTFFVEFFKDHELQQRARVINKFKPDLTVIIHYNVNEKNTPWLKPSDKNFCMAFVPGCIIADNIQTNAGKINLLRLLLTSDLDESEKISSALVNELTKQLQIPIAKITDANYLSEHCMATPSAGVYCRNLALCRLVQSPMVYGECLYQDNEQECYELIKNTDNVLGIQTNKRVVLAAQSFLNAIIKCYAN